MVLHKRISSSHGCSSVINSNLGSRMCSGWIIFINIKPENFQFYAHSFIGGSAACIHTIISQYSKQIIKINAERIPRPRITISKFYNLNKSVLFWFRREQFWF